MNEVRLTWQQEEECLTFRKLPNLPRDMEDPYPWGIDFTHLAIRRRVCLQDYDETEFLHNKCDSYSFSARRELSRSRDTYLGTFVQ